MTRWRDTMCGDVGPEQVGQRIVLAGWVDTRRDHGGLVFVDLRDKTGICQIVVNPERAPDAMAAAHATRNEFVLRAEGEVVRRAPEAVNPNLPTGEIEVQVDRLEILSRCPPLPFQLDEEGVDETLRLRYRWLDLRRPRLQRNIALRSRMVSTIRRVMDERRLPRDRDADPRQADAGRGAGLPRPEPAAPGALLRAAAVAADLQAAPRHLGIRPLLPDRAVLPGRGPSRRPCAGDHSARRRDGVSRRGGDLRPHGDDGFSRVARDASEPSCRPRSSG